MPDLTARAEEAFLGAVISDPRQLRDLGTLRAEMILPPLQASEFTDPARQAVWTAISRLEEVAPGARGREMTNLILATSNDPLITRYYLAQLALSAPNPGAAAVYARMISEAALIRELATATQAPAGDSSAQPGDPSFQEMASYAANLTAARSATADDVAAPGPPPPDQRAIQEERFLAGLIGHQELTDWIALEPGILTSPGLDKIYQAVITVDRHGEPADEVTIAWAAARIIAQNDSYARRTTTPQTLADTIPPGTIARLVTTHVDPLTALEAGRDLLAGQLFGQIGTQASSARGTQRDITAGYAAAHADTRGRALSNGDTPLQRPPADHQQRQGPQISQEGN